MPIMVGENYKIEKMRLDIVLFMKKGAVDEAKSERMKAILKARYGDKDSNADDDEDAKEDSKGWLVAGYFANLENVLSYLINLEIERVKLKDLQTVVDVIKQAKKEIKEALEKISEKAINDAMAENATTDQL